MEEIKEHQSVRDAAFMVKHDILKAPEITYAWDHQIGGLEIEFTQKDIDNDGTEHIVDVYKTIMLPDSMDSIPEEVVRDLSKRIPIRSHKGID